MSLETPSKIRTLQRKLYRKAKDESNYRFYLLYDKIYREDILAHAYDLAKANQGAPASMARPSRGSSSGGGRSGWRNSETNSAPKATNRNRCDG